MCHFSGFNTRFSIGFNRFSSCGVCILVAEKFFFFLYDFFTRLEKDNGVAEWGDEVFGDGVCVAVGAGFFKEPCGLANVSSFNFFLCFFDVFLDFFVCIFFIFFGFS
jgi:hypothetical protein